MPSVLFVCTANRFRSPLGAACFSHYLAAAGRGENWRVSSAGTWAQPGLPAMPDVRELARNAGLSLENHRAAVVSAALLEQNDLILVMEAGQKEALQTEFPTLKKRIYLLSEVADGDQYDIPDPVVKGDAFSEEIAHELCGMVERGFYKICVQALRNSMYTR